MLNYLRTLLPNEILYTTSRAINYRFISRDNYGGIVYSINNNRKTLPLITILTALNDSNNGIVINRAWYRNFDELESRTRGCNLLVFTNLINRYNSI